MKIKNITKITLNEPTPVYDITVTNEYDEHNFMIKGGVFIHNCCGPACHDGVASAGSPNVYANGIPVHRIGDAISCSDVSANGSPNVFANG